jgi:hypothetical protein
MIKDMVHTGTAFYALLQKTVSFDAEPIEVGKFMS